MSQSDQNNSLENNNNNNNHNKNNNNNNIHHKNNMKKKDELTEADYSEQRGIVEKFFECLLEDKAQNGQNHDG